MSRPARAAQAAQPASLHHPQPYHHNFQQQAYHGYPHSNAHMYYHQPTLPPTNTVPSWDQSRNQPSYIAPLQSWDQSRPVTRTPLPQTWNIWASPPESACAAPEGISTQQWVQPSQGVVQQPIQADCTVNEYGDSKPWTTLARTQIPLTAGYAITTHKSQGMTLDKVEVDLSRTFEAGQAYVALSRARSLEGLKVVSFPRSAQCGADPQVQEFLREKFPESFKDLDAET